MTMRDVVYYIASTLDGFIAHEDGSFDGFLWDDQFGADLFAAFPETFPAHLRADDSPPPENQRFDTVLMGRKTYEVGSKDGFTNPYPTLKQYVFSRTMKRRPDEHVTLVSEHAVDVVETMKQETGKAIWICGGAEFATTLFSASLVDKLIIKLNPVVFGAGIPLFDAHIEQTALELTESTAYPSGHMLLQYTTLP